MMEHNNGVAPVIDTSGATDEAIMAGRSIDDPSLRPILAASYLMGTK